MSTNTNEALNDESQCGDGRYMRFHTVVDFVADSMGTAYEQSTNSCVQAFEKGEGKRREGQREKERDQWPDINKL